MPMTAATTSATSAAATLVRVARISREKMSWPEPSAPSQCALLGLARMSSAEARFGSWGASQGAKIATSSTSARKTMEINPVGFFSSRRSSDAWAVSSRVSTPGTASTGSDTLMTDAPSG
jgi:hypothetical protein